MDRKELLELEKLGHINIDPNATGEEREYILNKLEQSINSKSFRDDESWNDIERREQTNNPVLSGQSIDGIFREPLRIPGTLIPNYEVIQKQIVYLLQNHHKKNSKGQHTIPPSVVKSHAVKLLSIYSTTVGAEQLPGNLVVLISQLLQAHKFQQTGAKVPASKREEIIIKANEFTTKHPFESYKAVATACGTTDKMIKNIAAELPNYRYIPTPRKPNNSD